MIKSDKNSYSSVYDVTTSIGKIMKGTLKVYEAFKKLIASGVPPITLQKCKAANLADYKIYGDSIQEGKNLFDGNFKNGYITGSTIKSFSEKAVSHYLVVIPCKPNTTYVVKKTYATKKFTVCFTDAYPCDDCSITNYKNNDTAIEIKNKSTANSQYLCAYVYNRTIDTLPVPEISVYEELSPQSPYEIESVGEKTKNILTYPFANTTKTTNGITFTDNGDGTITANGTATADAYFYIVNHTNIFKVTGTYSLSGRPSGGSSSTYSLTWNNVKSDNGEGFTTTQENRDVYIYIVVKAGTTVNNVVFKPMLEESNKVTEYEPPNKYKIPVKVSGENLLSEENMLSNGFVKLGDNEYYVKTSSTPYKKVLYKNETLYQGALKISFDIKYVLSNNLVGAFPEIHYTDGSIFSFFDFYLINTTKPTKYTKATWTTDANKTVDYIIWSYSTGSSETYIKNFGIYIKENAPVTTNIYLNEPLRKIGDDADYIDFEKKQVIRKIAYVEFTGDEGWVQYATSQGKTYPCLYMGIYNNPITRDASKTVIFTHDRVTNAGALSGTTYGIWAHNNQTYHLYFYWGLTYDFLGTNSSSTSTENATALKNYLKQEISEGRTPRVYFVRRSLGYEDIELPNIPTFKGTTVIEVDTSILPSNMEITYKGKGKNQLLNETENVILNDILQDETETELDLFEREIIGILDEIIGG